MSTDQVLRAHAEQAYADELAALAAVDDRPRPPQWRLSPWAVATYLLGGTLPDGTEITAKYLGNRRLIEIAIASLATDRALLLIGVPGTAKSWVSEHLAAAISGTSTLVVQGTAGTPEEAIRYGWNYARLLAEGPTTAALVPGPVMRAMAGGALVRVEELTRIPADIQDSLITILSEKTLPIPELDQEVRDAAGGGVDLGISQGGLAQHQGGTVGGGAGAVLEHHGEVVHAAVSFVDVAVTGASQYDARPPLRAHLPSCAPHRPFRQLRE